MIDILPAFENGNKGISIWKTEIGFQVNLKKSDGSFGVSIAPSLEEALYKTFGGPEEDDDLL